MLELYLTDQLLCWIVTLLRVATRGTGPLAEASPRVAAYSKGIREQQGSRQTLPLVGSYRHPRDEIPPYSNHGNQNCNY